MSAQTKTAAANPIDENRQGLIGKPLPRVDGVAKVTGAATYAYEYAGADEAKVGVLVEATVARGRIAAIDTTAAERTPGVHLVMTYRNAPAQGAYGPARVPARFGARQAAVRQPRGPSLRRTGRAGGRRQFRDRAPCGRAGQGGLRARQGRLCPRSRARRRSRSHQRRHEDRHRARRFRQRFRRCRSQAGSALRHRPRTPPSDRAARHPRRMAGRRAAGAHLHPGDQQRAEIAGRHSADAGGKSARAQRVHRRRLRRQARRAVRSRGRRAGGARAGQAGQGCALAPADVAHERPSAADAAARAPGRGPRRTSAGDRARSVDHFGALRRIRRADRHPDPQPVRRAPPHDRASSGQRGSAARRHHARAGRSAGQPGVGIGDGRTGACAAHRSTGAAPAQRARARSRTRCAVLQPRPDRKPAPGRAAFRLGAPQRQSCQRARRPLG